MAVLNFSMTGDGADRLAEVLEGIFRSLEYLRFSAGDGGGSYVLSCEVDGEELAEKLARLLPR